MIIGLSEDINNIFFTSLPSHVMAVESSVYNINILLGALAGTPTLVIPEPLSPGSACVEQTFTRTHTSHMPN